MLRFTIRDVLWLTVVVGLGLIYWMNPKATLWERRANAAAKALEGSNFASQWHDDGVLVFPIAVSGTPYRGQNERFYRSSGIEKPKPLR